jgi:hypothetical protein
VINQDELVKFEITFEVDLNGDGQISQWEFIA